MIKMAYGTIILSKNISSAYFNPYLMSNLKNSPSRLILEVIGLTLLAFFLAFFIGFLFLASLNALGYELETIFALGGATITGQIGFLLLAYVYIRFRDVEVPLRLPSRTDLNYIAGGTVIALVTAIVLQFILNFLDMMPESPIEEIAAAQPTFLLALAFLSIVLIAPAEELLFRGAIQGRLRQGFSAVPAIVITSVLFGSLHLGNYIGSILPILLAVSLIVVISLILGALYERTQNIVVPISVHAIYNVVLLVASYFAL